MLNLILCRVDFLYAVVAVNSKPQALHKHLILLWNYFEMYCLLMKRTLVLMNAILNPPPLCLVIGVPRYGQSPQQIEDNHQGD